MFSYNLDLALKDFIEHIGNGLKRGCILHSFCLPDLFIFKRRNKLSILQVVHFALFVLFCTTIVAGVKKPMLPYL